MLPPSAHHRAMPSINRQSPPQSETELLDRCRQLAGRRLADLAAGLGIAVPADLRRNKGWVGQLLEAWLGADAGSQAEPDFTALGIEMKTVPICASNQPCESTYVCTVPLEDCLNQTWASSWLRRKLTRVLWLPVEGDKERPLAERRVGNALLWSPDEEEEEKLRRDWEELMDMVCLGQLEQISARHGEVLQIRPKAANSRVLSRAVGGSGAPILTNPRGFYLRPAFTAGILCKHYATRAQS